MASRSRVGLIGRVMVGVVILVGVVLACAPAVPSGDGTASAVPPATHLPSPSVAGGDAPPEALLGAEGGDPVAGQLGTYVWLETGSDAPWLPGAPLAVGAGEPLTLRLVPDGGIQAWSARFVPAAAAGPGGATSLGEGSANPTFAAPEPGAWTVEVSIEFAGDVGNASYFWLLEVE